MGIYDREYYRDDSRGPGFFSGDWSACKALIWANVALFLVDWLFKVPLSGALAATQEGVVGNYQFYRLVTYALVHVGPLNLLFNMLFLWMAGREVESIYGKWEFVRFYLTATLVGGLAWLAVEQSMNTPGGPLSGTSPAVLAILIVYAMYYPTQEVLLFFIARVPMWLFVAVYAGLNVLGLMGESNGRGLGSTAFATLMGGGYGFLYKYFDLRWSRILRWPRRRPNLRVYAPENRSRRVAPPVSTGSRAGAAKSSASAGSASTPTARTPDEHLDARVDEILAKIAREGRSNLTDEENSILQEASLRARNRRGEHP